MDTARRDFIHSLLFWGTGIVAANLAVILWHLSLVVRVQAGFPRSAIPFLILANLLPVIGIVMLARGHRNWAGIFITVPLAAGFIIGITAHFLRPGTDNVLHMPPGELTLPFQISAVALVILEALGCWVGIKAFMYSHEHGA
jgi:hypothetical protein